MLKNWWKNLRNSRKVRKLDAAIKLCQSHGLTCCEIATKAGTDYIKGKDGSWHRIGGKSKEAKQTMPIQKPKPNLTVVH